MNGITQSIPGPGQPSRLYVELPAPSGTDTFVVRAFPSADNDDSGTPMAIGSATTTITANNGTDIEITMNAIPASLTFVLYPSTVLADGAGGTVSGNVTVLDDAGNSPVLPSGYSDAEGHALSVTVSDSDASGATTFSPATFNGIGTPPVDALPAVPEPITIRYDGAAIGNARFTAVVGTLSTTATLTASQPPAAEQHTLYVASHAGSADEIDAYALTANGPATPMRTITGSFTFIDGLATDASGDLYAANQKTSMGSDALYEFSPTANGGAAPPETISGSNTALEFPIGLAIDAANTLYALNAGASNGGQYVTTYASGTSGNAAPTSELTGPMTELAGASAIAVDGSKNIFIVNDFGAPSTSQGLLLMFAAGMTGNVAPTAFGSDDPAFVDIAIGPENSLFVSESSPELASLAAGTSATVNYCIFEVTSSGAAPQPGPLAVDAASQLFAANEKTGEIYVYPSIPPLAPGARCVELAPYRALQIPSGRTIDAIAVGR